MMYTKEDIEFVVGLKGAKSWQQGLCHYASLETGTDAHLVVCEGELELLVAGYKVSDLRVVLAKAEELQHRIEGRRQLSKSGWSRVGSDWVHGPTDMLVPEKVVGNLGVLLKWLELPLSDRWAVAAKALGCYVVTGSRTFYISRSKTSPTLIRVGLSGDLQIEPRDPYLAGLALNLYDRLVRHKGDPPHPWCVSGGSYAIEGDSLRNFDSTVYQIEALKDLGGIA